MDSWLILILSAGTSFIGSWSAVKVHLYYLRRDIDRLADRVNRLEGFTR